MHLVHRAMFDVGWLVGGDHVAHASSCDFFFFFFLNFFSSWLIKESSPPVRAEEVDRTLQQQDSGVESALAYAKAWSKYTKELLAWVEKRLNMGEL